MTVAKHPLKLLRPGLDPELSRTSDLVAMDHGSTVEIAGMVTARQRPETANGVTFILLEDERGQVNLVVPPPVYERHRPLVRTAPLIRARGRLERREGTINVLVDELAPLERIAPADTDAPARTEQPVGAPSRRRDLAVAELRAAAPGGHSFGRRG
jgi:error-prone DNA polymerase